MFDFYFDNQNPYFGFYPFFCFFGIITIYLVVKLLQFFSKKIRIFLLGNIVKTGGKLKIEIKVNKKRRIL